MANRVRPRVRQRPTDRTARWARATEIMRTSYNVLEEIAASDPSEWDGRLDEWNTSMGSYREAVGIITGLLAEYAGIRRKYEVNAGLMASPPYRKMEDLAAMEGTEPSDLELRLVVDPDQPAEERDPPPLGELSAFLEACESADLPLFRGRD